MHRRDVFRLTLRSGAVAVVTRLADDRPVDAADLDTVPKVEFQKGTLRGGKFEGWQALLAITGRAVRGTIYDPDSLGGGRFTGYRVRGTARGAVLDLDFYELEDTSFEKPVGGGRGKEKKGGKTTTRFEIEGKGLARKQSGSMVSKAVTTVPRENRELAGFYRANITNSDTGDPIAEFELSAAANGKFTIAGLNLADSPNAPKTMTGRFGGARDGSIYATMLLPVIAPGELSFDPSEVHLLRPAPSSTVAGQDLDLRLVLAVCAAFGCDPFYRVEGMITEHLRSPRRVVPVEGAVLHITDGGKPVASAQTDAAGRFAMLMTDQLGNLRLVVSKLGYASKTRAIDLARGRNVHNFVLRRQASPTGSIRGRVTQLDGGGGIGDATVELLDLKTSEIEYTESTLPNGNYARASVVADTYLFRASSTGYLPSETTVEVEAGQDTTVDFQLQTANANEFQDETFIDADWEAGIFTDPGGGATVTAARAASGGKSGPYRRMQMPGAGSGSVSGHVYRGTYNPQASGAISSLTFGFSLKSFGNGAGARVSPLVRQNGTLYAAVLGHFHRSAPPEWTSFAVANATQFSSAGGQHPDFTAAGGPVQFGYALFADAPGNDSGIDNWSVDITSG